MLTCNICGKLAKYAFQYIRIEWEIDEETGEWGYLEKIVEPVGQRCEEHRYAEKKKD